MNGELGQMTSTAAGVIPPTDVISSTGQETKLDGVTMAFQMTRGTEAPVEMNTWFTHFKALWMIENCTGGGEW